MRNQVEITVLTDGFTEVDGILEFLSQNGLASVARHFEEEEAGVTLGEKAVCRVVFVHDLMEWDDRLTNASQGFFCGTNNEGRLQNKMKQNTDEPGPICIT